MEGLTYKTAWREDERSSHWDFSTSIRPFMWMGALIGVLPCTAQKVPIDGSEESNTRVIYKFSLISFPSFVTVVWWIIIIVYTCLEPFDDPYQGKERYGFLNILNYMVVIMYAGTYFPMWIILLRIARLSGLFTTMAELDAALPSRSIKTCLMTAVSIGIFVVCLVLDGLFEKLVEKQDNILPRTWIITHVSDAAPMYMMLMWTFIFHLAQKFELVNLQVTEAMKFKDAVRLSHLRSLHCKLRSVVREVDSVFSPLSGPFYIRLMMMICMQLVLLDTNISIGISEHHLWIMLTMNLMGFVIYVMTHALPDLCSSKAASTIRLLETHDYEDDAFSRQVSWWRAELASTRVCITASGLLELNMPGLWTETQFMITVYVVLIQFTRASDNSGVETTKC